MNNMISNMLSHTLSRSGGLPEFGTRPFKIILWMFVLVGVVARLFPFIDIDHRLYWQYMTEDGYLLQAVARNMAIGLGMTTAAGTIPTNGFQPLVTFLFTPLYVISGGGKFGGIVLVTILSIVISILAAIFVYRVASRVLSAYQHGTELAAISAASWFAAPHIVRHSMNGLETGLYWLMIFVTLDYYFSKTEDSDNALGVKQRVILGLLLGLTFLARNDAVFFIGALLLTHLTFGSHELSGGRLHRLVDCLVAGTTSMVVALPWLVNNYLQFGSIIPISGHAESYGANFGHNLSIIPATLFDSSFIYMPIPQSFEQGGGVLVLSVLSVVVAVSVFGFFVNRLTLASRRFFGIGFIFLVSLSLYYGLFFGAPHFLQRYFSPLTPILWLAVCVTVYLFILALFGKNRNVQMVVFSIVLILLFAASTFAYIDYSRGYAKGTAHEHKQVITWVQNNVPDSQWVGASQSGTLGFFHDRTINLDGKVNPGALQAKQDTGDVLNYVINSKINYIADWYGLVGWMDKEKHPEFANKFEVLMQDKGKNLTVLHRIGSQGN